ncbi:BPTI/Kunitz domain-containing protein-like [Crotalus tigris]|uniref:BPTI/Kunitz domain-containing protein-like n=1 Tax=Crotalus tigris TaxID=88082 RepID=UPI00192F6512|nr:BPTI/Kunitz domain-containing protein-like [Crotalus tigris]
MHMLLTFGLLIFCFQDASSTDICQLPREVGWCKASFPRFYFNTATGNCEEFIYGGCRGNKNNFVTLDQCKTRCGMSDICTLPKETGWCKASFPRFYFNAATGTCENFIYGGCRGNANNFATWVECRARCQRVTWTPIPDHTDGTL